MRGEFLQRDCKGLLALISTKKRGAPHHVLYEAVSSTRNLVPHAPENYTSPSMLNYKIFFRGSSVKNGIFFRGSSVENVSYINSL